jgi:hypothetical protein
MGQHQSAYLSFLSRKSSEKRADLLSNISDLAAIPPFRSAPNVGHPIGPITRELAYQNLKEDALRNIKNIGLTSLGIGAGAAGLKGLVGMLRQNVRPRPHALASALMPLPLPVEEKEEKKEKDKQADDEPVTNIRRVVMIHIKHSKPKEESKTGFDKTAQPTALWGIPWYYPGALVAAAGGTALGWKGINALLKRRADKEREQSLEAAKEEFHQALLSQYTKPLPSSYLRGSQQKESSDSNSVALSKELDKLFDKLHLASTVVEKRGGFFDNLPGGLLGGYGVYAGTAGTIVGKVLYDAAKKRNRQAILEKALKSRERSRFARQPTELLAVPEIVQVPREEEEEKRTVSPIRGSLTG